MTTYIVSRDILAKNVKKLQKRAGPVPIWAVIKGDGYGLGALVFSFMPGLFADACGSYAPSYLVFLAFGVFSLLVVQSTYRQTARSRSVL